MTKRALYIAAMLAVAVVSFFVGPHVRRSAGALWHKVAMVDLSSTDEIKDLERTTAEWQHKLRMDDWKITMMPTTQAYIDGMTGVHADAASQWDVASRQGIILVLRRDQYSPETMATYDLRSAADIRQDQRNSIAHEFLHCVVGHADEEFAVVILSGLLEPENHQEK